MPSSLDHIHEIFDESRQRSVTEREAFLTASCAGDAELRAEVESLLEQDSRVPDDFLRPAAPPGQKCDLADGPDPLIGTCIGQYQIRELIAAGGMGAVYLAEQAHPRRQVAIKVMKHGSWSRSALKRFDCEADILGRLRHPHIAVIHDAGLHTPSGAGGSGLPYFVMEYIAGARPITAYAREHALGTRERLELFCQVCDAVHYGHQRGIIHRDLKPANILIDSAGGAKVIDFGVARFTDSDIALTTVQTDVGQLIGTLQYMSPEQCDADPHELDVRSDVYSLGVVLYELLTDSLPYDVSLTTLYGAARTIKEQPPARPSSVNRRLRSDVETIVLTALEKDRGRRYQSVADLLRDIRHYLACEPIEARPPTAWTRAVRWVVRHPALTTAAVCLIIGAVFFGALYLSVQLANARPWTIKLSEDGHAARLLAIDGAPLYEWDAEPPGTINFARLIRRPTELGGDHLGVLGFSRDALDHRGKLCAFEVDHDCETVAWSSVISPDDLPAHLRDSGWDGARFHVARGFVFDVFSECPGDEIVVVFACTFSPCLIRIYDLHGEVLWQVWHDGSLSGCYWMSQPRLLVFIGANSEATWAERGHPEVHDSNATVVFALRPRRDFKSNEYVHSTAGDDPSDALSPAWYQCVLPPATRDALAGGATLLPPEAGHPEGCAHVELMTARCERCEFGWDIDECGHIVPGSLVVSDEYRKDASLPDPNSVYLDDLPPIVGLTPGGAYPPPSPP